MVYADDINMLGGSVHIIKKNTEVLVVASKETGCEVNAVNPYRTNVENRVSS